MGHGANQKDCSGSQGMMVYQPNIKNYLTSKRNNYQLDGMDLNNAILQVDRVEMVNFDESGECRQNRMFSVNDEQLDSIQLFITKTRFINSSLAQDGLNYSPSKKNGTDMCSEEGCTGNRLVMFSADDRKQMISPEAHAYLSSAEKPLCQNVTNYFLCHNQSLQLLQIENWKYFKRQTLDVSTLVGRQNGTMNDTNT